MASSEGLNLFQQPTYDTSIVSRADTEYYPSDMTPDNNKESIIIEVINKSETDFIDLKSTEILADLQICDTTDNADHIARGGYRDEQFHGDISLPS